MKKHIFTLVFAATLLAFSADLTAPRLDLPLNEGDTELLAKSAKLHNPQLMSWVDGPAGKALYLDNKLGEKNHALLTIPIPDEIRNGQPFTISLQVKTPAQLHKSRQYELLRITNGKKPGLRLHLSWKRFRTELSEDGINAVSLCAPTGSSPQVEPDRWYSIGITYDGKEMRFYRNGEMLWSKEATYKVSEKAKELRIGATSSQGVCYYYEGAITNFKYFAEALTPEEMAKLATLQ